MLSASADESLCSQVTSVYTLALCIVAFSLLTSLLILDTTTPGIFIWAFVCVLGEVSQCGFNLHFPDDKRRLDIFSFAFGHWVSFPEILNTLVYFRMMFFDE